MSRIRLLDFKLIRSKASPSPGLLRLGQEPMMAIIEYIPGFTFTVVDEFRRLPRQPPINPHETPHTPPPIHVATTPKAPRSPDKHLKS